MTLTLTILALLIAAYAIPHDLPSHVVCVVLLFSLGWQLWHLPAALWTTW